MFRCIPAYIHRNRIPNAHFVLRMHSSLIRCTIQPAAVVGTWVYAKWKRLRKAFDWDLGKDGNKVEKCFFFFVSFVWSPHASGTAPKSFVVFVASVAMTCCYSIDARETNFVVEYAPGVLLGRSSFTFVAMWMSWEFYFIWFSHIFFFFLSFRLYINIFQYFNVRTYAHQLCSIVSFSPIELMWRSLSLIFSFNIRISFLFFFLRFMCSCLVFGINSM